MHDLRLIHVEDTDDNRTRKAHYFVRDVRSRADSFKVVELGTGTNHAFEGRYFVQKMTPNGWTPVVSDVTADSPMAAATLALQVLALITPQRKDY